MPHSVQFVLDGDHLETKVICTEPPESMCRWRVADLSCDCEIYYDMGVDEVGPYHSVEGPTPDLDDRNALHDWLDGKHRMIFGGPCSHADWLQNSGVVDSHMDGRLDLGTFPIQTEWTGDDYVWRAAP